MTVNHPFFHENGVQNNKTLIVLYMLFFLSFSFFKSKFGYICIFFICSGINSSLHRTKILRKVHQRTDGRVEKEKKKINKKNLGPVIDDDDDVCPYFYDFVLTI